MQPTRFMLGVPRMEEFWKERMRRAALPLELRLSLAEQPRRWITLHLHTFRNHTTAID